MLSEAQRQATAVPSLKLVILGLVIGGVLVYGVMSTTSQAAAPTATHSTSLGDCFGLETVIDSFAFCV